MLGDQVPIDADGTKRKLLAADGRRLTGAAVAQMIRRGTMDAFARPRLERLLAERGELATALDARCARLLKQLRDQCPGAIAPRDLDPGATADPVVVRGDDLDRLLRAALASDDGDDDAGPFLLADGESALLVDPARSRVLTADGLVLVVLGVDCDQTGPVEVTVPFAVGGEQRDAGMIATTEARPRGPAVLAERWGEALIALAWEALVSVFAGLTRHAGTDLDVAPLIPGAMQAAKGSITVVPQARHPADRLGG